MNMRMVKAKNTFRRVASFDQSEAGWPLRCEAHFLLGDIPFSPALRAS
jgi:hypothetical protein